MRIAQDARFRVEAGAHGLRFTCEHCAFFDGERACSHEYPTELHRAARYREPDADLVFCKEWESA